MIESDSNYTIRTGTKTTLDAATDMYVRVLVDGKDQIATIMLNVYYQGTQVDGANFAVDMARFDALSKNAGTAEFTWFIDVAEQIIVQELSAMPENSSASFTIS